MLPATILEVEFNVTRLLVPVIVVELTASAVLVCHVEPAPLPLKFAVM